MTGQDVKALPVEQKIQIMEAIWEDFRDRFDRMMVPEEQRALLDQRRVRVRQLPVVTGGRWERGSRVGPPAIAEAPSPDPPSRTWPPTARKY